MKSCVIQMPRRAAAGGECLAGSHSRRCGSQHVAVWCCWAEPAPASAPAPSHADPHPVCNCFSSDPCRTVSLSAPAAGASRTHCPSAAAWQKAAPPGRTDVPPRRGSGAAGPLSELVHLARALRPGVGGCPHGGWGDSHRGAGTAHSEAGQLLWECHECPQYQGLVLWL